MVETNFSRVRGGRGILHFDQHLSGCQSSMTGTKTAGVVQPCLFGPSDSDLDQEAEETENSSVAICTSPTWNN